MLHELLMEFVTAAAYLQASQNRHPQQSQVPQNVQDLVPHEFFRVPQASRVHDAGVIQDQGIIQGAPPGQSPGLQELDFF